MSFLLVLLLTRPPRPRRQRAGGSLRLTPAGVVAIFLLNLAILALLVFV